MMAPATWGTTVGRPEADAALLEELHDAPDRLEAIGAAAGEHDGVEGWHQVARVEEVQAAAPRGGPADLDAADRGGVAQDHCAPGQADGIGGVTDLDARDHADVLAGPAAPHVGQGHAPERDVGRNLEAAPGDGRHPWHRG